MGPVVLIDGNSLLHRAFYALPDMITQAGEHTGAVYGFVSMLLKLVDEKPSHLLVAFDMHGPTFRHKSFAEYKAGRKETPDELRPQFPLLKEVLGAMGISMCECEGFEADDILGTYAKKAAAQGMDALIVTGDRDAFQLVDERVNVLYTKRGITETERMDIAAIQAKYGLEPALLKDVKGLMGDASDNIPGVPGVGEKTALKLIKEHGCLEAALESASAIGGKLGENLTNFAGQARLSYNLGTIETGAPVDTNFDNLRFDPSTLARSRDIFTRLEFRSLANRLPKTDEPAAPEVNPAKKSAVKLHVIEDISSLKKLASDLAKAEVLAFAAAQNSLFVAPSPHEQYEITQGELTLFGQGLPPEEIFLALKPLFESSARKLLFDSKQWRHTLFAHGISPGGEIFDLMLADYLLHAIRPSTSLEQLIDRQSPGAPAAACMHELYETMLGELGRKNMLSLYADIELPLANVLFEMERHGFCVDSALLRQLGDRFEQRAKELATEIYAHADEHFNILSTKQLGGVLFDKLGLPHVKKTKTGYSTDAEVLEKLEDKHPIIVLIVEYRTLTKLKSTFIDGMLPMIDSSSTLHTSFRQNVTATGRISSIEPNLQNIPVRTELGREIRRAFIAGEGRVLVDADYSQIELRVLAHMSNDPTMIAAFIRGEDIHARTAAEVTGVPLEEVTAQMRSAAKAVNFGIVYGISDFGLARNLGISRKAAADYIERYLERYGGIREYMQSAVEFAKQNGFAATLFNRRRELPELLSSNHNTRGFGERVAMNMPIQGTAADIIKLAMNRVSSELVSRNLNARLALQVHDELIVDTPEGEAVQVKALLKECMEGVVKLRVPLVADVHTAKSWFDAK